jgi:hypothetical protein
MPTSIAVKTSDMIIVIAFYDAQQRALKLASNNATWHTD